MPLRAAGAAQGGRAQGSGRLRARQPRRGELTPHTALALQAGTSFPADLALASAATPGTGPAPVSGRAGPVLEAQVAARLCGEHRPERRLGGGAAAGRPLPAQHRVRGSPCSPPWSVEEDGAHGQRGMIDDTAARSQAREGCPARVEQASLTGAAARGPACRGDVLRAQRGGARGPLRSSAVVSWRHQTDRSTLLPGRRGSRLRSSGAILPAAGTPRGGGRAGKFQRLFLDLPRSCFQSGEAEKVRRGHVILAVKRSLRTPTGRRRTATPPQKRAPAFHSSLRPRRGAPRCRRTGWFSSKV